MAGIRFRVNAFRVANCRSYTDDVTGAEVKNAARTTRNSPVLHFLARLGFAVSGLLHAIIGVIAIEIATGASGDEADQSGALGQLASKPGGEFLLWVVVIGLTALGLWLVVNAFVNPGLTGRKRVARSLGNLGKAVVYFVIAFTALTFARGGTTDSATSTRTLSAKLLAAPGGVFVVFLIGLAIVGVGVYCIVKGATRRFKRDLAMPRGALGEATAVLAVFGYVAKGVALGVVGVLFIVAALTANPANATGLDGGLKALVALPFGPVILIVVGIGFIAYALYSLVRARLARL